MPLYDPPGLLVPPADGARLPYAPGTLAMHPGNGVAAALVQNDENAIPFWTDKPATLGEVSINVTTLGATSAVRLGIREDAGLDYPYPGALISDEGTLATTGTGVVTWTAIDVAIEANRLYWLTFTEQGGTPPSVTCYNSAVFPQLADTAIFTARGYKQTGITGALGSFSATIKAAVNVPRPMFKWAA